MGKANGLGQRRGWYYARERVPLDILKTFGETRTGRSQTEVWEPLNTKSRTEARAKLVATRSGIRSRFDAHRQSLQCTNAVPVAATPKTPQHACAAFYAKLQESERARREAFCQEAKAQLEEHNRQVAEHKRNGPVFSAAFKASVKPAPTGDTLIVPPRRAAFEGFHAVLSERLTQDIVTRLANARGALAVMDVGHVKELSGETDETLLPYLARTEIAFLEAVLADPGALFNGMPPLGAVSLATSIPLQAHADTPLLSAAAAKWREQKVREGWTEARMLPLLDTAVALLQDIGGDKILSAYTKADAADFKDILLRLPKNRTKNRKTRDLSAREAAETGEPPIHLKTANDYIRTVGNMFDWALQTYDGVIVNHFGGITFNIKSDQREEGDPFALDDLKAIFAGLVRADVAEFWAPILALYTGCRSNELLKLKTTDVRQEDGTGIWYFDINEDTHKEVFVVKDKSVRVHHTLKRSSHRRRIPVQADLVSFGFLDFLKRAKGERLFGELRPNKQGKFSDAFGKWFNRYLKDVGVKRPKLNFHSFRHNFVDACDGRMPDDIIKRLKGDARGGTLDRYGAGMTEVEILAVHLAKMQVKGLDLRYLRP